VRRESYTMTIKVVAAAKTKQEHKAFCSMFVDESQGPDPRRAKK